MRKSILFLAGFAIYGVLMWYYLFHGANSALPVDLKGSAADPAMFMTDRELELSTDFSRIKDFLYFISVPLEWLIYLFVLGFGLSRWFRKASSGLTKFSIVHTGVYVLLLSFASWVLTFPLKYYSFTVSKSYHISVQSFHSWMRDSLVDFWISWLLTTVMVAVMYWLIRKNEKKWWLYAWMLSIPFTIFMYFIQPVVIDPLYNDFYPLKDQVLKEKILKIADKADIPAENVYEVNMSQKTNALNAYVNGIGSNLRIVLWDTTLNKLTDNQVLFVMAHEMGHYVMNHLYWNLISSVILSFLGLWLGNMLYRKWIEKYGKSWGIKGVGDLAALPVLLLIFSLLSFAVSPVENAVSRKAERDADLYAIEMTKNPKAAVGAFQELATVSLSEVNPPKIVKWFLYGHPTMLERLHFLDSFEAIKTKETKKKQ
ncbi:M48 family metallopeptidase [Fictibacillus barbaricus]|uniref:Zn-dependent protease with chaperone function n=1 Tax=Fictibacillus barbaricus TaxID=182136 RepID=A0ABU1TVI6_9BACL|nr:M48 family metallopeptidase [Fictibacillus barbaricus]MDR7071220.1 Zn-dependent protease with chaperone function [Fictibacillus barbaricus]